MRLTTLFAVAFTLSALAFSTPAGAASQDSQAASDVRTIEITAERYRFVPSEIEVVEGETVRLRIRSVDVAHGFAVPDLGISATVPPGQEVTVEFAADTRGRYPFQCSVFCGPGHTRMGGSVTVLPASADSPVLDSLDTPDPIEPDFSVVSLPTALRLPRNRLAFRIVHRFSRPLDGGAGHGNILEDFFGFDSPALIGLELRYGLAPGLQVGIHRNNTRSVQLFGKYSLLRATGGRGTALDAIVSIEGLDNLREEHSPSFGAILSQRLGSVGAIYVEPMWVENADNEELLHPQVDPFDKKDDDAFVLGLGARVRVLETVSIVAELLPRLSGFDQGKEYVSVGIEKQAGGHVFQVNFSNSVGTTPAQLAQGGSSNWFVGFNISRRFY